MSSAESGGSERPEAMDNSSGSVSLSAQELLSLVEKTINTRLAKEEPKSKKQKVEALRFKGNQKQLEFNSGIRDMVAKGIRLVDQGESAKAVEILQDVKDSIDARNKMVRLADRSGWDVVDEYLGDSIASDSEDERKIRSAEQRAFRKRKLGSDGTPFRHTARGRWPRARAQFSGQHHEYGKFGNGYEGSMGQVNQHYNGAASSNYPAAKDMHAKAKAVGTCFYCGKAGHWASNCDQRRK